MSNTTFNESNFCCQRPQCKLDDPDRINRCICVKILERLPFMVWSKDISGVYNYVNQTFEEYTGIKRDDIIGKTDYEIWPLELTEYYLYSDKEVIDSGEEIVIEDVAINSSGNRFFLETTKIPIFDNNKICTGIIGFAQDRTKQKELDKIILGSIERLSSLVNGHEVVGYKWPGETEDEEQKN